jgi:hypothetical protein
MICRSRHTFASSALALLQVQFLWVTMLHRHGEMLAPWSAPQVVGCDLSQSPGVEGGVPCTACQIVRNSALQPATDMVVLQQAASVPLPPIMTRPRYHSLRPASSFSRAPPLS